MLDTPYEVAKFVSTSIENYNEEDDENDGDDGMPNLPVPEEGMYYITD